MIEYRSFQNSDPPRLVKLWHDCQLGRGAAAGFSYDAFETFNFSQPYFDPHGLIVAWDGPEMVGFVHAGFGVNEEETGLAYESGVICAVMVHPAWRRRGIGRELVARAEHYLQSAGATEVFAGPSPGRDPFYVGLYGGGRPAGFLESDPDAGPFFEALGYEPADRHAVYERDLSQRDDPMNIRLLSIRRKMELAVAAQPKPVTWWWATRFGRLDSLRFLLVRKGKTAGIAGVTVVGLDLYLPKWHERAAGLTDLWMPKTERRKGYGQALVLEACRRLRDELVTRLDAPVPETNEAAIGLLESTGFKRVDTGVVYRRPGG